MGCRRKNNHDGCDCFYFQGLIIAFTSSFIPKLVYMYGYTEDGSMKGFVNFTLSSFNPKDFQYSDQGVEHPKACSYYDFRQPPDSSLGKAYDLSESYWHVLAARLLFVVIFQNVVMLSVMAIKWIVPNIGSELKERMRREAYLTNELIIKTELLKVAGKIDENGQMISQENGGETSIKPVRKSCDSGKSNNNEEITSRLLERRRLTLPVDETGDITDGNIVL